MLKAVSDPTLDVDGYEREWATATGAAKACTDRTGTLWETMKPKKMKPIPPELKRRFARNQQRLLERIEELEREIAARETPPQT